MKKVMTAKQLAEYLQLNILTIYKMVHSGEIPAVKIGRTLRFKKDVIDRWLEIESGWDQEFENLFLRSQEIGMQLGITEKKIKQAIKEVREVEDMGEINESPTLKYLPPLSVFRVIEDSNKIFLNKFKDVGIFTTSELLVTGATSKGRKAIANKANISEKSILAFVKRSDLFRIKGVREKYSGLLDFSGVNTIVELAQRNPKNLYDKLIGTNREKGLVLRLPSEEQVADWIEQAKELPRIITY